MFRFTIEYHYESEEIALDELICHMKENFENQYIQLDQIVDISTDNDCAYDFIFKSTHKSKDELVNDLLNIVDLGSDDDRKTLKQMIDEV